MVTSTTGVMIPLEEYLETTYRPDCDWIDGEVMERNLGEKPHNRIQFFLCQSLGLLEQRLRIVVLPEQRVQTSATHYRVADVCVTLRGAAEEGDERIVRVAPLLCVEILSRTDSLASLQVRVDEYVAMGTRQVWLIDPLLQRAYTADEQGKVRAEETALTAPGTEIEIPLVEMFAALDIS